MAVLTRRSLASLLIKKRGNVQEAFTAPARNITNMFFKTSLVDARLSVSPRLDPGMNAGAIKPRLVATQAPRGKTGESGFVPGVHWESRSHAQPDASLPARAREDASPPPPGRRSYFKSTFLCSSAWMLPISMSRAAVSCSRASERRRCFLISPVFHSSVFPLSSASFPPFPSSPVCVSVGV